ncbi:MAG: type VI secretion system-associated FHA domain protein TagH, partial [Desulfobacteraceae bacterium]|nr:type VI secretion system-associated FHA domain protein TagH [Desulfobacteraceae bacterium]
PEKYISRNHARIYYENGFYYLLDTSSAGTYLPSKGLCVHQETVQLVNGDVLRIGDYDIIISISGSEGRETVSSISISSEKDPFLYGFDHDKRVMNEIDIEAPIGNEKAFSSSERNARIIATSPLHESLVPPRVVTPDEKSQQIPEGFKFEELLNNLNETEEVPSGDRFTEVIAGSGSGDSGLTGNVTEDLSVGNGFDTPFGERIERASSEPPADPLTAEPESVVLKTDDQIRQEVFVELFNVFLDAVKIEDKSFFSREKIPDIMEIVGTLFREMIDGLMTILRGRAELKAQTRVVMTVIRSADNNPLKFSPSVEHTLKLLLTKNPTGFVDPVEAIHEACTDIMNHQLAMTAGIQAALGELLKRFNPQHFAKKYEEGIVFQKKAKYWDAYSEAYDKIVDEAWENFFGKAYTRVYEEQMFKLRSALNKR